MTSPMVRSHARHAPRPTPTRDELQHISAPLVVQVAWSAQRQRWVWFEYLDEIEDLVEQPLLRPVTEDCIWQWVLKSPTVKSSVQ